MPLLEGQVQVRDLVMGPATDFKLLRFNPFVRNTRANQNGDRAWSHGTWSGVEWSDEVVVPLSILPQANRDIATWMTLNQQLAAAFRPVGDATEDVEMRFCLGGQEYVMHGRPRMVEPDTEILGTGLVFTEAAFVALDPFIYAGNPTEFGPIGLPTYTGGLSIPVSTGLSVPFSIPATLAAGFVDLTNPGTAAAGLNLRIDGPAVSPWVALQTDPVQVLRLNFDVPAGQWVDVDTEARTVLLNGVTSRRGLTTGDWLTLPESDPASPVPVRLRWQASAFHDDAALSGSLHPRFW